jgi:plasmid segregation protein ParM
MYVVGADIGYNSLKVAHGAVSWGKPRLRVWPALAVPERFAAQRFVRGDEAEDAIIRVWARGESWLVGVEPSQVQGRNLRDLHEDYTESDGWEAMLAAALSCAGRNEVDLLVVGLPVSQYHEAGRRDRLMERLVGEFQVSEDRFVCVKRVEVLPQPGGAMADYASRSGDSMVWEGRVVVVDPGYYSFDWAVFGEGVYRNEVSGTGHEAMSKIVEGVAKEIGRIRGVVQVSAERVEHALRTGSGQVLVSGEWVNLKVPLCDISARVVGRSLSRMRSVMRGEDEQPDLVLVVGGGARCYEGSLRAAYPNSHVEVAPEPVLANVRGYWSRGCGFV